MFCVYVLESVQSNELYIGYTNNLTRRLAEHNNGTEVATKRYMPWKCIHCEHSVLEEDARRREGYLKTTQGRRMLKLRLKEYFRRRAS